MSTPCAKSASAPKAPGPSPVRPGVTDADLILGKLDPDNFAGGTIKLHPGASKSALSAHVGDTLDMGAVEAAFGVAEVVDENMANAARVHAVENGEDLSDYTMIAFGGAAPLHAGRLCEKLGVDRLLVPEFKVYMRYTGQGWEIPIALTEEQAMQPDAATFEARFIEDYTKLFGRAVTGMDIEITVWSVNATTPPETVPRMDEATGTEHAKAAGTRQVFDAASASYLDAGLVNRADMAAGHRALGPVAIVEDETTIIVPASRDAICQPDGCIDVITKEAAQ